MVKAHQHLVDRMTSPKGMDELFWDKDLEDVFD
jgi:hypothetical protein